MFAQVRDFIINGDFLLAARAVKVSKSNLGGCPAVSKHHLEAAGVEDVSARELNTRFFAKFTAVANTAKLALSTSHSNTAGFIGIDGILDAFFVEAGEVF